MSELEVNEVAEAIRSGWITTGPRTKKLEKLAVAHNAYKSISVQSLLKMYKNELPDNEKILLDVKSIYRMEELSASGIHFWRL